LGIETLGGVMTKIIEKNTTVPVSRSQIFSTAGDNQTSVEVHVLQGEREMAQDNKTLGKFFLDGIPPAPRGMPQVEVAFDIDANGILSVKAVEKKTNKEQSIRIEASSTLSKEDIEKMKKDAELHAEEDRKKRELIDARNHADALVYTAEKSVADAGDKVEQSIKDDVKAKIENLKKAKDSDKIADIETAQKELSQALSKIGEALYKQQPAPTESSEPQAETKESKKDETKDNIKDTEHKDINE